MTREIMYLRPTDEGTDNECWFVCNRSDAGAMAFISADYVLEICAEHEAEFLSPEYATDQPLSSFSERFACRSIAASINGVVER